MICKYCGEPMYLEEADLDNPHIRTSSWSCECGGSVDMTWWGQSEEAEETWDKQE